MRVQWILMVCDIWKAIEMSGRIFWSILLSQQHRCPQARVWWHCPVIVELHWDLCVPWCSRERKAGTQHIHSPGQAPNLLDTTHHSFCPGAMSSHLHNDSGKTARLEYIHETYSIGAPGRTAIFHCNNMHCFCRCGVTHSSIKSVILFVLHYSPNLLQDKDEVQFSIHSKIKIIKCSFSFILCRKKFIKL